MDLIDNLKICKCKKMINTKTNFTTIVVAWLLGPHETYPRPYGLQEVEKLNHYKDKIDKSRSWKFYL